MKTNERAVVAERRTLSKDAFLLFFESPTLHSLFMPGQFTMVRVPGAGLLLRRPYSFCASEPEAGRFSLLVKVVGEGTRALVDVPEGKEVDCLGPLGTWFKLPEEGNRAVMVAGGVGIAPFLGFCQQLEHHRRKGIVLLGGRGEQDLYLREDFERLGMDVRCTTEDGSFGSRGVVTDRLPEILAENEPTRLYSCGPTAMLKRAHDLGLEYGIAHQVSVERRMGCGMGCCWGCVIFTQPPGGDHGEYRRSCTEGPVFDADDICWERDPHPL